MSQTTGTTGTGTGTGTGGSHSLAFRVMRLCRPSFNIDPPLRLHPSDLFLGEDLLDHPINFDLPPLFTSLSTTPPDHDSDPNYRNRFLLHHSSDPMGLSSLLVLPQSFGAIYLGETFCSYISINNSSNFEVTEVVIKAEIQTERQRILLLDTSKSPVESIRAGGRYDFIVEHDVKELGPHTLVCTALYNDGDGERKYLPQFFKFIVANPLSVRTKVRVIKETTFLEACIENHTKSNLFMDQVDFEPAQHYSATILKGDGHHSEKDNPRETFKAPVLIRSGGGIYNYLYQLKSAPDGSSQTKVEGSNVLGKLQITWRTNLGEPGRLQTQHILGTPTTKKDIELQLVDVPSIINLQKPFMLKLSLTNQTDREMGPFEVSLSQNGSYAERVVVINGLQSMILSPVEALGSTNFHLNLIATKPGIQRITGITVYDTKEMKSYEPLPDLEIFVDID
ncbi:unnamed protein product [Lupinus luteus]|uniref:Trafficking protein particle complex subunit 13 n=1 Tax=Lupinus luteus TaxID=3873 RepID=A0AAV1WXP0_LUPLU